MSPIFRHRDEGNEQNEGRVAQWRRSTQAEFESLGARSLIESATEAMTKGFGRDRSGADGDPIALGQSSWGSGPTAPNIFYQFAPDRVSRSPALTDDELGLGGRIVGSVAEGQQELEHGSLVRCQLHNDLGYLDWAATRGGRVALESDEVQSELQASRA